MFSTSHGNVMISMNPLISIASVCPTVSKVAFMEVSPMSYAEIVARCETEPVFFLGCICWAAFAISLFAALGWRLGKTVCQWISGR